MTDSVRQKVASRKYKINYRAALSIFIVFTLCGLWHGAGFNFIAWGVLHGLILGLESLWLGKVLKKWWLPLQHAYLLIVVTLSWALFRSVGIKASLSYFKALFGFSNVEMAKYNLAQYLNNELLLAIIIGIIGTTPIVLSLNKIIKNTIFNKLTSAIEVVLLILMLTVSIIYMASSTYSPFLYQQF